ncbi:MAG TPA: hypothetical protein VH724_13915 [Candidatus Angelobacter sp.]|nr:hypothetical protein [Candidatus Angelobacter sp.]
MNNEFELDSLLKKMAAGHQPELPSPGLIWWRAQILRKQQEKERIERPLMVMRALAIAVCVAAFVWLWISQLEKMSNLFSGSAFPLLLAGAAVTIVFVGLVWWTRSEA